MLNLIKQAAQNKDVELWIFPKIDKHWHNLDVILIYWKIGKYEIAQERLARKAKWMQPN